MADMIWKGYRNGKGSLKIGDKFILPGGKIPQNMQSKIDSLDDLKKQGLIGDGVSDVKPVDSPSTEKGKKSKKKEADK